VPADDTEAEIISGSMHSRADDRAVSNVHQVHGHCTHTCRYSSMAPSVGWCLAPGRDPSGACVVDLINLATL
jgi:hypothetical protein